MKRLIICLFVALCCSSVASAIPAYRGRIVCTQPDGSKIVLRQNGDEFCHWLTNEDGQVVEKGDDGFYRVVSTAGLRRRMSAAQTRRDAVNRERRSVAKRGIASGTKHFLVILVQFQDVKFNFSGDDAAARTAFNNLLNQNGYSVNGGHGSARDFYYQNSGGYFEPIFDVYGPVTLANNMAYYGGNDSGGNDLRPRQAVKEACQALDSQIDFTQYDNDSSGDVDLVFMYYAGYGEADSTVDDSIWPHQWSLSGIGTITLDGKKINSYACTNEIIGYGDLAGQLCGIGTACHEFGHAMGLPDFYDTDYETNGEAGGLYEYSTMCSGSYNDNGRRPPYFNMEERNMLGWPNANIVEITSSGTYNLTSVNNNVAYKSPTDKEGEYFLYECRSNEGWDIDLPEHGLIVYHVDKSDRSVKIGSGTTQVTAQSLWDSWGTHNAINENGSHPCFYVVPAGAQSNLNYSGSKFACPGAAKKFAFTGVSWNGVESSVKLSNISYSGGTVSFYAEAPSMELNYNVIANPNGGVYHAGDSFALTLSESEAQPVSSVQWYMDDEPLTGSSVVLPAGTHVIEAHITLTTGETKIVELTVVAQ